MWAGNVVLMAVLSHRTRGERTRRENRDALLAATLALLAEDSAYADLSIEQIVRRAGLSRPTFYAYFQDKRALVLELGEGFLDAVAVAADPFLTRDAGDAQETLVAVLEAFRAHRQTATALVEAATYDPEVRAFWTAFHERFVDTASARICLANPDLSEPRARARAFALVWMTERTLIEHLAAPSVDENALVAELAGFWEHALAPA